MGWKLSMVIIENKEILQAMEEESLLRDLGYEVIQYHGETTLEECHNPGDNTISIGYYNGNIILCDSCLITDNIFYGENVDVLSEEETILANKFPTAEILSVACNSSVNFHGYSLIRMGEKFRFKTMLDGEKEEHGAFFEEELELFKKAKLKGGIYYWQEGENEYVEDQLMEDFTFEIAKRRLGVRIDMEEGDELFEKTPFRKYSVSIPEDISDSIETEDSEPNPWKKYLLILIFVILYQIIKFMFF